MNQSEQPEASEPLVLVRARLCLRARPVSVVVYGVLHMYVLFSLSLSTLYFFFSLCWMIRRFLPFRRMMESYR